MGEEKQNNVALIVGVTGMAGLSIAEALKSPTAPSGPWKVYGAARHAMPNWFPSASVVDYYLTFDATDTVATNAALSSLSSEITHLFWVALHEAGEETRNTTVNSAMLSNVINALVSSGPASRLRHVTLQTGTKQYLGPVFDPVLSAQLGPPESPFREDAPRLPFPKFYYALEDVVKSYAPRVTHSMHRSSIIIGASARSVYNPLLTVAVYAEIFKRLNASFRFPGSQYAWEHLFDATDVRVLAEQQVWAAFTKSAQNEAFNCANGDVFTWRSMWRVLSDTLGAEFVELDDVAEYDWLGFIKGNEAVWDRIVEENELVKTAMHEIISPEALQCVTSFEFQHDCNLNKSKEFGFIGFVDFNCVRFWIGRLREMKIIP